MQMLSMIEKFKNLKYFLLKNSSKIGKPFGTLVQQVEKLAHLWHVYWSVGTLTCKNEMFTRFWHVGTRARGHVDCDFTIVIRNG